MERRPDIGFDSYDRFFPNQDTLPHGGFGNLIALPLQKHRRGDGNSVFLDDQGLPDPDQWAFLSTAYSTRTSRTCRARGRATRPYPRREPSAGGGRRPCAVDSAAVTTA